MTRERLYFVHGMGNDAVGLVKNITTPIADDGGNIVDLRQDVLHGLFTIDMVVDLSGSDLRIDSFKEMVKTITEDTGVQLSVEKYNPVARNPHTKNMLLILVGGDRPGIIASISQVLAKYQTNIEFSQTIGREGVFLMELLTDISAASLPLDNLVSVLRQTMAGLGMQTIVQTSDVFNKKKRVLLFDIGSSFMSAQCVEEILRQTGLGRQDLRGAYPVATATAVCAGAAAYLEGCPLDVINTIAGAVSETPGTAELLQRLKIMGYKIGLLTNAFSVFTDALRPRLGLDYCSAVGLAADDDTRMVSGEYAAAELAGRSMRTVTREIAVKEGIAEADVTVLSDTGLAETPGIRLDFNLETVLGLYNKKIISTKNLLGILGSFGAPRAE